MRRLSLVFALALAAACKDSGPEPVELRRAHTELVVLVSVVRELLDANRVLAGQSLLSVRTTVEALGGLLPQGAAYDAAGAADPAAATAHGRLVRQSA